MNIVNHAVAHLRLGLFISEHVMYGPTNGLTT